MPSFKHTSHTWPENVGIIAIDVYFPSQYVCQTELEQFDGVSEGKYTIGLGQSKMGFCTDREDINSLCLTVLTRLMEETQVGYANVGRLEVGTETIIDKSKSVKSVLMQLFEESGNMDVEGVDTTNACYGGTAALLNAINWVESSAWDGRYAVVVAGDIAVYSQGPARPTGGAGAVAMLIGPNAPLVIERGLRSSYMRHAYDFYKPDLSSEYPTVDGKLSIELYLTALDSCYHTYLQKAAESSLGTGFPTSIHGFVAFAFHSPYCRLVQKSFARLLLNDFFRCPETALANRYPGLEKFREKNLKMTYFDKDVEKAFLTFSKDLFEKKTKPSLLLPSEIGNMYTPSLYSGLVSILANLSLEELAGKRIGLFSYGSGLASTMFSIRVSQEYGPQSSLWKLSKVAHDIKSRLTDRHKIDPQTFANIMAKRERTHHKAPYSPSGDIAALFPGTWYLTQVDELHRRKYSRVALIPEKPPNSTLSSCGEESTSGGASLRLVTTNGHTNGGEICEVTTT